LGTYNLGLNKGHPTESASVTYAQEVQRGLGAVVWQTHKAHKEPVRAAE
jgi:hypothetical protein